jgi:hypothetical protein
MSNKNENITGPGPGPDMGLSVADPLLDIFPAIFVVLVLIGGCLLLVGATSSLERYKRFRGALEAGRRLFVLFGYGVATVVLLVLLAAPVYLFATAESSTQGGILKWGGMVVGVFLSVSGLGWLTEKWWKRVEEFHDQFRTENKPDHLEEDR